MINAGTFGSEPHMPFGGLRQSGNGSREPGTEALDVYSELKDIYIQVRPKKLWSSTRSSASMPSVVALIPARSGSKRVADKNARCSAGIR